MFSRDNIWLNKTYSQHLGISQVCSISSNVEDEDVKEEENNEVEGETHFGPPPAITEDYLIEQLMDVPETT
jgi:hypothetical protein